MNQEEFAELAAGYALGALSPEDLAAFETARAQHPEWQRQVTDAETFGVPPTAPVAAPPAPIVAPGLAEADITPPTTEPPPNTETIQTITRRNWTRGMLLATASVIVLVVLGFGSATLGAYLNRPTPLVALGQVQGASDAKSATAEVTGGGTATLHWSPSLGKAVLVTTGLPSVAAGKGFEVWYVRSGSTVPAGTFDDPEAATVILKGAIQRGDAVTVTVEARGGAPGGQPTSKPIARIPTS